MAGVDGSALLHGDATHAILKYLLDEKMKVGKVKEAILKSLSKADSLLKAKL